MKETYYKLLNLVTLGKGVNIKINDFNVRIPVRYYKYYTEDYEKENFDFYKQVIKKEDVVIDIGGHIGLNAVVFGKLATQGKVYSFEPAPNTNKILNETVKINALQNTITVENYAMSSKKGSTVFFMANTNLADNANSLVNHRVDKKLNEVKVTLTSIDDFVIDKNLPKVDFIKIDAEGVEYDVLVGARKTLEKYKPKMTLGLHPTPIKQKGDSLEAIYDLLAGYNYNISLFGKTLTRKDFIAQQDLFDVQLS